MKQQRARADAGRASASWWRAPGVVGGAAIGAAAVACELVLGRAGGEPSTFVLFAGRFHPLVVHLPIGVLVLVGAAELASVSKRLRARVDPVIAFALPLGALSAVGSFVVGHLLARAGGFGEHALSLHKRLALVAVIGAALTLVGWTRHTRLAAGDRGATAGRALYRGLLAATLGALSVGAHFGGSLSRGEGYLAKYAPDALKPLLGGAPAKAKAPVPSAALEPAAPAAEPLVYRDVIAPMLERTCVPCHGGEAAKGALRLDSMAAIAKGGESGPAMVAGASARSLLVQRMRLPAGDDDRMPPEGKPAPTADEIAAIAFWIDRGATETLRVRDTLAPTNAASVFEVALRGGTVVALVATATPAVTPTATATATAKAAATVSSAAPATTATMATTATPTGGLAWDERVGPILAAKCVQCHGAQKQKGRLRLDTREAAVAKGNLLVARARLPLEADGHMPPPREPQLTSTEIDVLAAWLRAGAGPDLRTASLSITRTSTPPATRSDATPIAAAAATTPEREPVAPSAVTTAAPTVTATPATQRVRKGPVRLFAAVVQPILMKSCGACHSGKDATAGLRVDDFEALKRGGFAGAVLVPGKPNESSLVERMRLPMNDAEHMPPARKPQPTRTEIGIVRYWISLGATPEVEVDPSKLSPGLGRELTAQIERFEEGEASSTREAPEGPKLATPARGGCAGCSVAGTRTPTVPDFGPIGVALAALALRAARRVTCSRCWS